MTLRPEGTAGVLRAVLEHGLHRGPLPVKLWYCRSVLPVRASAGRPVPALLAGRRRGDRRRRPGARRRGASCSPSTRYRDLGLDAGHAAARTRSATRRAGRPTARRCRSSCAGLTLDEATRRARRDQPAARARRQAARGPGAAGRRAARRRLLCEDVRGAPRRGQGAARRAAGVDVGRHPRLVRGLDYYTRTTFEFQHDGLGAQSAVGGGGRYDGLSEEIGGPPLPGVGWALGVDRTVLALEAEGVELRDARRVRRLRRAARRRRARLVASTSSPSCAGRGIAADLAFGDRGLKGAMKAADRSRRDVRRRRRRPRPRRPASPRSRTCAPASRPRSRSTPSRTCSPTC